MAGLAPAAKRGRYMSLFGLSWNIAAGIGPIFGGMLNDTLGPQAIWYGGGLAASIAVLGFLALYRRYPHQAPVVEVSAGPAAK